MLHLTDATDLKEMIGQLSKGGQQSIEPFIARQPAECQHYRSIYRRIKMVPGYSGQWLKGYKIGNDG